MQGDPIAARVATPIMLLAVSMLAAAAPGDGPAAPVEDCPFEQTWYAGDVHFWETLEVGGDATGIWTQGGMDGDAGHDRRAFRWARSGSTLTVRDDRGREATVGYQLDRDRTSCILRLDVNPFDREGGFTVFSDVR